MRERDGEGTGAGPAGRPSLSSRLSIRLFAITALAVMSAEVLIFVPSIANFRRDWLESKLETVSVATLVSEFGEGGVLLSPEQEAELLRALDARLIAIREPGVTKLLARAPDVGGVDLMVELESEGPFAAVAAAFDTLAFGGERLIRLVGPIGDGSITGEIVIEERPLRRAMLASSRNILLLSLSIASFAGALVFGAINLALLGPIRRMTQAMVRFAADPEDPSRIIAPSRRRDELGMAERELAGMQSALARTLREQRHLADLGLAVSKINHDLRNILASAQLVSDRLSDLPDAQVQRFAPILIRSLDRALVYTQSVLAYGQATESLPTRRHILLRRLVDEVFEMQLLPPDGGIELVNAVPERFEVEVDPEQMFRALSNLVRNAVQALEGDDSQAIVRRVSVLAERTGDAGVRLSVEDTGPGLSEPARAHLFKAFRGSTRAGGTGLGLAIAAEIVAAHGGRIRLSDETLAGARFEVDLPSPAPVRTDD
ncbi:HAMP domain-containing sensor histidine kinase [Aureimonas sp. AU12]|uniref:sensor histidine kinase n=1 Tax=Aureimonas sp. AU12 TaxID=1638161 RepID=UPI0007842419|nr:HAMP domain-containing sensor histidine kinase [Aureimonas sp. AU12]